MVTETFPGINPQVRVEYPNFLVGVRCFTFNHGKYITDTMNGFCMQQTDFPFVCIIIDDASTDGEQHIIREYMSRYFSMADEQNAFQKETDYGSIIYGRHIHNKNCYFAVVLLKENHHSQNKSKKIYLDEWGKCKYYALCEGDDYWIDPLKLQKQVDFMEGHPDFSLCGTNGLILWEEQAQRPNYFNSEIQSKEISFKEVTSKWFFPTAGLLYKREIIDKYPNWTNKIYSGDLTLVLIAAYYGKIYYFRDYTCVYRKGLKESASAIADKNRLYVLKQHRMLYTYYAEFTNGKYAQELAVILSRINNQISYLELKSKNYLITWLKHPLRMFKEDIIRKLFYKTLGREKTHMLFH